MAIYLLPIRKDLFALVALVDLAEEESKNEAFTKRMWTVISTLHLLLTATVPLNNTRATKAIFRNS